MAQLILPNLCLHGHCYAFDGSAIANSAALGSLCVPKPPAGTQGHSSIPVQPVVKNEKARGTVKQETQASAVTITEMFMKRKQEHKKQLQLMKHPAPEASKPAPKRAKAASPDPTQKVMAVLNIKAAKAQCLLKESMGDVNAAVELGLAQEESNTQVGQLIKEEMEAKGAQDNTPTKGHIIVTYGD